MTGQFIERSPSSPRTATASTSSPLGVDTERLRPDPNAPDPLPSVPHPRVLFVGRLRHYKGLAVIAAALARLERAQLLVVGDGPERTALEEALRASGCRDRAHLLGEVDDERLLALYQTSDAAVLASTSNAEAFGLSVAEAQSCGVPAVTTEVGTGTAQTIADGVSGRIAAERRRPSRRGARLVPRPGARTGPAPRRARAHAESHLCARRMTATIAGVYGEIVG